MAKTIKVRDLLDRINHRIAKPDTATETRSALCALLEGILHQTGNYAGFQYNELNMDALKAYHDHTKVDPDTVPNWGTEFARLKQAAFGDENNRVYYIHRHLLDDKGR